MSRVAIVVLLLASACAGTETGNPIALEITIHDDTPDGPVIDGAWLAVDQVGFRRDAACTPDTPATVTVDGPFLLDLGAGTTPAELAGVDLAPGGYCSVELIWAQAPAAPPDPAPAELGGVTVLLTGDRGDGTPFVLRSARTDLLQLDAVELQTTIPVTDRGLFVDFDADQMLQSLDLDTAVIDADGTIRIEVGANDDLLALFARDLHGSATLYDDDDGDGVLDPAERAQGQGLAFGR
jgi:hypothetical protein